MPRKNNLSENNSVCQNSARHPVHRGAIPTPIVGLCVFYYSIFCLHHGLPSNQAVYQYYAFSLFLLVTLSIFRMNYIFQTGTPLDTTPYIIGHHLFLYCNILYILKTSSCHNLNIESFRPNFQFLKCYWCSVQLISQALERV